jgi:DNA topoisomerase I
MIYLVYFVVIPYNSFAMNLATIITKTKKSPKQSALEAGLVYVTDTVPGISRKLVGKTSQYFDINGKKITNDLEISRFSKLAIPPAYKHVWISPLPNTHIQAVGWDAKGRKQYRYHEKWKSYRANINHYRMIEFGKLLPKIRRHVQSDLQKSTLSHEKVLATVVNLLDTTLIRIGNEEYAKTNNSFGLTTMKKAHVHLIPAATFEFRFKGKSHKEHDIEVHNHKLFKIVSQCMELPGFEVFQYVDEQGNVQDITSTDVNSYLKKISGQEISAKDFRTWWSTVLALIVLENCDVSEKSNALKRNITLAMKHASQKLGNTPSVCRKHYVYPGLLDAYLEGKMSEIIDGFKDEYGQVGLSKEERKALYFLEYYLVEK